MGKQYLDDNGNPISEPVTGKQYLDDNGNAIPAPVSVAASQPAAAKPGAGERFMSSAGSALAAPAVGIYHAVTDAPRDAGEAATADVAPGLLTLQRLLVDPQVDQARQAQDTSKSIPERIGHGMASVLPVIGPWAAQVAEQVGQQAGAGDLAGAAGTLVGNAPYALLPKAKELLKTSRDARVNKLAYASGPGTTDLVEKTLPALDKAAGVTGSPKTAGEYLDVINKGKNDLNDQYKASQGANGQTQISGTPIGDKIRNLLKPGMQKTATGRTEARAILKAAQEFDQPWTLEELDNERMAANARLAAYEAKSPVDQYSALKKSRTTAIDKAIADGVREEVYPRLDQMTGKPAGYHAAIKQQIGNLMELESKVDDQARKLHDTASRVKGAPPLDRANINASVSSSGKPHGYIHGLKEAVLPKDVEASANKQIGKAFGSTGSYRDIPMSALMAEQQGGPKAEELRRIREQQANGQNP